MKDAGVAFVDAIETAPQRGIVPRRFVRVTVKDLDTGDPVEIDIWTGDWPIEIDVPSGVTGDLETRTYQGGLNLWVGDIVRGGQLNIETLEISLSAVAVEAQALVRGYSARLAKVEVHVGLLDPDSRLPVDDPAIEFLGELDGAPIQTGAVGSESLIKLQVRSDAISMLTRTNPKKRSAEAQKRRSGDEFGLYANSSKTWQVPWGMEGKDDGGPKYGWQRSISDATKKR